MKKVLSPSRDTVATRSKSLAKNIIEQVTPKVIKTFKKFNKENKIESQTQVSIDTNSDTMEGSLNLKVKQLSAEEIADYEDMKKRLAILEKKLRTKRCGRARSREDRESN